MAIQKISSLRNYFKAIILIALIGCANQLPPGGGEVDLIPPEIIEIYPKDGTTDFKDNFVSLKFSEYVDHTSLKNSFFISPNIRGIEFDWSGREVEIHFKDSLEANTTYSVTIGSGVKDLNNGNKMKSSYSFAFSTGKRIDHGMITGRIYGDNRQGAFVLAYKLNGKEPDVTNQKPKYVSQSGKDGGFVLKGMAMGSYRLIALKDEDGNMLYSVGTDEYGVPFKRILLTRKDSVIENVNFLLTREDTLPPALNDVVMTDRNHIVLKFNEKVLLSSFNSSNCSIIDSTLNKRYPITYVYGDGKASSKIFLAIKAKLNLNDNTYLLVKNIQDPKKNTLDKELFGFTPSDKRDTKPPQLISVSSESGEMVNPLEPKIYVKFNDAFDTMKAKNGVSLLNEDSIKVNLNVNFPNNSAIRISAQRLRSNAVYKLLIEGKCFIDVAGNVKDTVYVKKIRTLNKLDFTGLEGIVLAEHPENIVAVLNSIGNNRYRYVGRVFPTGKFFFRNVLAGKYLLWFFKDKNNNGKYDYGRITPFKMSEKFVFYSDTLNLRKRWPVGGLRIKFK